MSYIQRWLCEEGHWHVRLTVFDGGRSGTVCVTERWSSRGDERTKSWGWRRVPWRWSPFPSHRRDAFTAIEKAFEWRRERLWEEARANAEVEELAKLIADELTQDANDVLA